MKKSWKLILIALLAALLVCTCMSAIADETDPGHGLPGQYHDDADHEVNVGLRSPVIVRHHDSCLPSQYQGRWGGIATYRYEKYCTICGYALGEYEYKEEFEECWWGEAKIVEPTCTETGSSTYSCIWCEKTVTDPIPANGHMPRQDWNIVKDSTCYSLGWRENVCDVCGVIYGENIPMKKHNLGVVVVSPATCTKNEVCQNGCVNPGCSYRTGDTWETPNSKLPHKVVEHPLVNATCETAGMTAYDECSVCGQIIAGKKEVIPALGHLYNGVKTRVQEATCQQDGLYVYGCSRPHEQCNKHGDYWGQLVNEGKVGHLHPETGWEIDLEPDCMHVGYRVNRCVWCHGDPIKEELPVVEHKFTTWVKEQKAATCTTDGYKVLYCDYNCGTTTTVTIPAIGHKAETNWRYDRPYPDCENDMHAWVQCAVCGKHLKEVTIPKIDHTWEKIVADPQANVEPTCTENGLYTYRCNNFFDQVNLTFTDPATGKPITYVIPAHGCGEIKTEVVPAKGHDYKVETTPATCTKAGKEVKTCKVCGDVVTTEIPALGHDYKTETVAPTCTKAGSETITCTRCGDVKSSKTIDALGHKAGDPEVTKAATCTEKGVKTTKCTVCGETLKTEEIPALGHKEGTAEVTKAATCTEKGVKTTKCTVCGATLKTEEIPALGHKAGDPIVTAATCTKAGSKVTKCTVCGETLKTEEIAALGHKEVVTETAATCTKAGSKVTKCSVCGETLKTEEIAALGHKEGTAEVTKAATCTEKGVKTTKCTVCGATLKTEEIPALGHKAGDPIVTAATCTKAGSKVTKCTVCGETLKTEEIPALGHKAGEAEVTKAATCTEKGVKTTKCTVCGEVIKTEEIPALGHKEEVTETAATCTEAGSKVTKCTVCGETLKTEEIPALGHKAGEPVVTAATCTVAGSEVTSCTVCGEVIETKEIPAAGHVPGKEKIEQNKGNTYCTVCGELLSSRNIPSSSGSTGSTGSSTPAATIYNGVINAAGIAASELGGNGASLVTPIDLSADGVYTYSLVAGDKYVVGTMIVTVSGGKATVSYSVKNGVTISGESLYIFANGEALKAGTATPASFNAAIDAAGDTKIILAVNLIGSFDVSIADAYVADAAQIAAMKALVD